MRIAFLVAGACAGLSAAFVNVQPSLPARSASRVAPAAAPQMLSLPSLRKNRPSVVARASAVATDGGAKGGFLSGVDVR